MVRVRVRVIIVCNAPRGSRDGLNPGLWYSYCRTVEVTGGAMPLR
jgi:hypothetical protein